MTGFFLHTWHGFRICYNVARHIFEAGVSVFDGSEPLPVSILFTGEACLTVEFENKRFFLNEAEDHSVFMSESITDATLSLTPDGDRPVFCVRTRTGWLSSTPDPDFTLTAPKKAEWEQFCIVPYTKASALFLEGKTDRMVPDTACLS